jgi:hypothetical protein
VVVWRIDQETGRTSLAPDSYGGGLISGRGEVERRSTVVSRCSEDEVRCELREAAMAASRIMAQPELVQGGRAAQEGDVRLPSDVPHGRTVNTRIFNSRCLLCRTSQSQEYCFCET